MSRKKKYEVIIAAAVLILMLFSYLYRSAAETGFEEDENGEPVPSLGISDLAKPGRRIAVLAGSELLSAAQESFPEATPVQYDTFADVFHALNAGKTELGYVADEKRFRSSIIGQVVAAPELGFLFPAFDGRATNIYNALFYSKNINASHQDFVDAVFRTPVPMSAGRQKESFNEALTGALDKDCSFDVIQAMHEQLNERIAVYKETRDPEPMTVTLEEMGEILENSGATPEEAEAFCAGCTEAMGENAVLRPGNLTNTSRMEITTPEVKISVNPKLSYLVEARVIDGKKYILVSADAGVELNGIAVDIRD